MASVEIDSSHDHLSVNGERSANHPVSVGRPGEVETIHIPVLEKRLESLVAFDIFGEDM